MTPEQFVKSLERRDPAPVLLFLGPETYRRKACRRAIAEKVLGSPAAGEGLARHDLGENSLNDIIDDARSMSLFAGSRVLWISNAEEAMPRSRAASEASESDTKDTGGSDALKRYCDDPTPGTVLIFDARKFDFTGEDKVRLERVRKFYAPVRDVVEFARFTPQDARHFAQAEAANRGLRLGSAELELLVEATAADPARIANELEKLSLFAASSGGKVSAADLAALVPDAAETTIFALVDALAARNRAEAMLLLDPLVREGEYLPLALTFLAGIFRYSLTAREQGLRSVQDVQSYFQRQGTPMWRARAEQIHTASTRFSKEKLEEAIELVFRADRALKSSRPDDRVVMEEFLLRLTA